MRVTDLKVQCSVSRVEDPLLRLKGVRFRVYSGLSGKLQGSEGFRIKCRGSVELRETNMTWRWKSSFKLATPDFF